VPARQGQARLLDEGTARARDLPAPARRAHPRARDEGQRARQPWPTRLEGRRPSSSLHANELAQRASAYLLLTGRFRCLHGRRAGF
jgi:hypothetical protein